jgi:hypothetical protein
MSEAPPLLHNMSAPPKSVVRYAGLSGLAKPTGPGGAEGASVHYSCAQHLGNAVRFELPPMLLDVAAPLEILERLGFQHDEVKDGTADKHLNRLINERANQLPLPEGCAVIEGLQAHPEFWDDPLATMAALTKSTDTVWLRGKSPTLSNLQRRRCISLLLPPGFMARIKETKQ